MSCVARVIKPKVKVQGALTTFRRYNKKASLAWVFLVQKVSAECVDCVGGLSIQRSHQSPRLPLWMAFTFSSFVLHTSKLHVRRKKTISSLVTPGCLQCKPWKLCSSCSCLHVLQFYWGFMLLSFSTSNFSVYEENWCWVHAHFIQPVQLYASIWATRTNFSFLLTEHHHHYVALRVLEHCLPSVPFLLSGFYTVLMFNFCLSLDQNSIRPQLLQKLRWGPHKVKKIALISVKIKIILLLHHHISLLGKK